MGGGGDPMMMGGGMGGGMGGPGSMFDGMGQEHLPMGVPESMAMMQYGFSPDHVLDTALQAAPELYGEEFNDIRERRLASIMLDDDVQLDSDFPGGEY